MLRKLLAPALVLFLASCGNEASTVSAPASTPVTDSSALSRDPEKTYFLEDLLRVKDQTELMKRFGNNFVSTDTIWGPGGMWTMGTFLFKGSGNEVEIAWKDSVNNSQMAFARIRATYASPGQLAFDSRWKTRAGLTLGMQMDVAERLNGAPFTFTGFDWEYGSYVDWGKGNFAGKGFNATFHYPPEASLKGNGLDSLKGGRMISSSNEAVRNIHPYIMELSVNEDAVK